MSEKRLFKESYSNLKMGYQGYSIPWYEDKKKQYSNPFIYQPVKLSVLEFWHETGATPYQFDNMEYARICKSLGARQVDNIIEHLKDLYKDFAGYLYDKQFGECLKYPDGSLVLLSYMSNGNIKIAYRDLCDNYYDFYTRLRLPYPDSSFSLSSNAMTHSGNIVSVEKLKKTWEKKNK